MDIGAGTSARGIGAPEDFASAPGPAGGDSLVGQLGTQVGARPAGSAASAAAAGLISGAFAATGAEVSLETFSYLGWRGAPVGLAVDGSSVAAAPCTWSLPSLPGGTRGTLRSLGTIAILPELLEAPAFAVVDPTGAELARLYVNPYEVAAAPFPSGRGTNLTGCAVWVGTEDGRRLAERVGAEVVLEVPDGVGSMRDANVVAEIPGASPELVVAGAHYDTAWNAPGFVDNGAGVEWLRLLLARVAAGPTPRRTLRVCAWTAEEIGLLGARRHVGESRRRGEAVRAHVNFDAVGASRVLDLQVSAAPDVAGAVDAIAADLDRSFDVRRRPPGPGSDQMAFHEVGVPVAAFIGPPDYPTYHQPVEDAAALDPELFAAGVKAAGDVTLALLAAN